MPGETDSLAQRHRDFFLALAEEAEPHLTGAAQVLWLNRLERRSRKFRAALSFSRSRSDQTLPRLAGALSRFWFGRSYLTEGLGWLEAALLELGETSDAVLGKVLNGAGMLSECCGDYEAARSYHERDLALRRELNDSRGIARALGSLSINAIHQKQFESANAYGQECLAQCQALGQRNLVANMLTNLGVIAVYQNEYAEAERLYRQALAEYQMLYDAAGSADALHNLGELFLRQSLYSHAQPYFRESLLAQRTLGNKPRAASTLMHLAATAGAEGEYPRLPSLGGGRPDAAGGRYCRLFGGPGAAGGAGQKPGGAGRRAVPDCVVSGQPDGRAAGD